MKMSSVVQLVVVVVIIIFSDLFSRVPCFIRDIKLSFWRWQGLERKKSGIIVSLKK